MSSKREVWVDYIKVFACALVVLGHFFQSMVKAAILPVNDLYTWFNTTIYYFHVPLFFICSGYLYQKYSVVNSWLSWKQNVIKKAVILGVPYFVFSVATWLLKTVFGGAVNNKTNGLLDTLMLHPTAPYWYLFVLFFIFVLIPTVKGKKGVFTLSCIAFGLRLMKAIWGDASIYQIYLISKISENLIWFVLGMFIAVFGIKKLKRPFFGAVLGFIFIILSVVLYKNENVWISFALGLLACVAVLMITIGVKEKSFLNLTATFTMPIFLMHTLFAAPLRTILLKTGMSNVKVQVLTGILISFIGPIVAMKVLLMIKMDWIVYPERLVKRGNKRGQ